MSSPFYYNDLQISVIDAVSAWNDLSYKWNRLWEETPDISVFMSHGFLSTWWQHRNKFLCRLHILQIKTKAEELVALVPLTWSWELINGFPMRAFSLMHEPWVMDRPKILYPADNQDVLQALCRYFISIRKQWDLIALQEQMVSQDMEGVFKSNFTNNSGFRLDIIEDSFAPFLSFPSMNYTWEDYLQTRTKKHRKKWRYLQNRLHREGRVEITRHTKGEALLKSLEEYRQVEEKSWKKRKRANVNKRHFNLYRKFGDGNSDAILHVVLLHLEGHPIAGIIGLQHGRKYAALTSSYDKDYSEFSPGFLIGGYDVQWAIENEFIEYDLMSGFLNDKLQWTDSFRRTYLVRIVRKDAYGGIFHFSKFRLNPMLIEFGKQTGILQYLKRRNERRFGQMNTSKFSKHNEKLGITSRSKE